MSRNGWGMGGVRPPNILQNLQRQQERMMQEAMEQQRLQAVAQANLRAQGLEGPITQVIENNPSPKKSFQIEGQLDTQGLARATKWTPPVAADILLEGGSYILLEDGSKIQLES